MCKIEGAPIPVNPMAEGFTVPKSLGRFGIPQLVGTPGEEDEEVEGNENQHTSR